MKQTTIVAKVFVINSNGLVLALRRSNTDPRRPLTWDLPGGGVDYGEDPSNAVVREAEEEAGIKIEDPRVFSAKSTNQHDYIIRLLYYVRSDPEQIKLSYEHDQYKWVTKAEYMNLDIPIPYKEALDYLPS